MPSIDCAARTEELARDLARYPRITLARFIAERFMEDARRGAFGNIALKGARKAGAESFAIFAAENAAIEKVRHAETRSARRKAEAERRLTLALKKGELTGEAPEGASPEARPQGVRP